MNSLRRNPTLAVLRTYTSWWLTWVILVLYLGGLVAIVVQARMNTQISKSVEGNWNGVNWDSLPADLSSVETVMISPIYLVEDPLIELQIPDPTGVREKSKLHYAFRPDSPLRVPGKFPRLKRMIIWGLINEDQLVKLLEFQQLQSLFIVHLQPLTDRGWSALERQPLEHLEILGLDQSTWKEGRWPKTIKTLFVQDQTNILHDPTPSHLLPLLQLPKLETVKVNLWSNAQGRLREKDVEALSQMPSLKTVYLDFLTLGTERTIQEQLPQLTVRPSYYQSSRVSWVLGLTLLGFVPLLFILHLLSLQMVTPSHSLVPDFGYRHWLGTLCILIPWLTLQTVAMMAIHCHWSAALSFSGVMLILTYLLTAFLDSNHRFPGYVQFVYLFTPCVACIFLLPLLVRTCASESDWFFQGQRYDVAIVLILLEAWAALGLYRFFQRLSRKMANQAEGLLPYGLFDFSTMQAGYPRKEAGYKWMDKIWGHGQKTRMDAALTCPRSSTQLQSLLWRASQPMTSMGFSIYMALVVTLLGGFFTFVIFGFLNIPGNVGVSGLWPLVLQPVFFTLFIPTILLAQRRPFLASHLLMSSTRRDWVRLVFRETASDFFPALIALFIGLGIYSYWKPAEAWSPIHIGLIGLGLICLLYAGSLYLITLSLVGKVVFFVSIIGFFVGMSLFFASLGDDQGIFFQKILAWPPTSWLILLSIALMSLKITHQRWIDWELT